MKLPFSLEEFLDVFRTYNEAIWPMQILLYLFGGAAIFAVLINRTFSSKLISLIHSLLWIWMGVVYHLIYFTSIDNLAYVFTIQFVLQGTFFFYQGVIKNRLHYRLTRDLDGMIGIMLLTYALVVYPVLSQLLGHPYPNNSTFGAPSPTVIFTIGFLFLLEGKIPTRIIIVPLVWSLVGFFAFISLNIREDLGVMIAGVLLITRVLLNNMFKEKRRVLTDN